MRDNTFARSFKLVPEVYRPFFFASLIALLGTGIRMIGPQLISRGIDNGVMKFDYQYWALANVSRCSTIFVY